MKMTDNKTFGKTLLLSGGKTDIDFVSIYLKSHKFDTVVCADSGLETACKLDVKVDCYGSGGHQPLCGSGRRVSGSAGISAGGVYCR